MKIVHNEDYRVLRLREYPPYEEFIDAYYWESKGDLEPLKRYLAKIEAIKTKYPKNEENQK